MADKLILFFLCIIAFGLVSGQDECGEGYPIVDTGVHICYNNNRSLSSCPAVGQPFYGQDAQYAGREPSYKSNGDGTVTDLNTGLMWQADPGDKISRADALSGASSFNLGGYNDWRVPTVKELYSLINYNGRSGTTVATSIPYIDTKYFTLKYGPGGNQTGERLIDCQALTATKYVSTTMQNDQTMFGVNFAAWAEGLTYESHSDWRLPNAKELQSIVDYTRSPDTTNSAAIDPAFQATQIQDEEGNPDYPWYWASTTHLEGPDDKTRGYLAVYVTFGRALGWMDFPGQGWKLYDVHGAGAQRSDPKSGDPAQFPHGHGPQGDVIRIFNFVRLVRNV